MRTQQNRRFIFIDFENLQTVKFKKLERVCSKIFILIDSAEQNIPFSLVRQIQKLGKAVKWIPVEKPLDNDFNFHLCYLMGTLHEKVSKKIEFAILSNDRAFDSLVKSINKSGRNCLRVKNRKSADKDSSSKKKETIKAEGVKGNYSNSFLVEPSIDSQLLAETATDTIQRLIRSGKRPEEVEMLRNYILLHNQEFSKHGNVDVVIEQLQRNNDIAIHKGAVTYNF